MTQTYFSNRLEVILMVRHEVRIINLTFHLRSQNTLSTRIPPLWVHLLYTSLSSTLFTGGKGHLGLSLTVLGGEKYIAHFMLGR